MAHHFVTIFLLLSIGYFQISDNFRLDSVEETKEIDKSSSDDQILIPRQEDDEEIEEEDRQQVVSGIGNILTGAFSLNLNKILKGAFSFADTDVQDNILNKLFFKIPASTARSVSKNVTTKIIDPNNTAATRRRRSTAPVTLTTLPATTETQGAESEEEDGDHRDFKAN